MLPRHSLKPCYGLVAARRSVLIVHLFLVSLRNARSKAPSVFAIKTKRNSPMNPFNKTISTVSAEPKRVTKHARYSVGCYSTVPVLTSGLPTADVEHSDGSS